MSCHNLQSLILQFHTPTSAYQWPQVKKGPNYTAQGVRQEWKQTVPCSHLIIRCRRQRTIHGVRPLQKHLKSFDAEKRILPTVSMPCCCPCHLEILATAEMSQES